jgi:phage I-like protein
MAAKPMARKAPPPAAPSSRAASNGSGGRNAVTLTREEREMAGIMGMTPEEYAKNKVALKKEGKLQ